MPGTVKITIGIKALNEERHVGASIASALAAVAPFGGEVILADCGSTDRTIAIAQAFPIRILQLARPAERSCGTGAQLAFQKADGDYFYILDGDMVLKPEFIAAGIAYLETHPQVAGVGGVVNECNIQAEEFEIRRGLIDKRSHDPERLVDRLDCGGLYRMSALRELGHFADRNLHAFEEFELGARLRAKGWHLARIEMHSVDHFGHTTGGYKLLLARMKSGYSGATGEVVRAAFGQPHWGLVLTSLGHVRNGVAVIAWWVVLLWSVASGRPAVFVTLVLTPLLLLSIRRGSPRLGLFSLLAWNVSALGLVTGLFRNRVAPATPIAAIDLSPPASPATPKPDA
ncbi:glycosyltransferase [Novosphingobium sp.]|uniref:glycosyltransferase n=1 Tax=Novosphingobium sp. TaxID=1874826 RepID=UPI003D10EA4E